MDSMDSIKREIEGSVCCSNGLERLLKLKKKIHEYTLGLYYYIFFHSHMFLFKIILCLVVCFRNTSILRKLHDIEDSLKNIIIYVFLYSMCTFYFLKYLVNISQK